MVFLARTLSALSLTLSLHSAYAGRGDCRNLPGNPGWPDAAAWSQLNATLGGQLITTVPQAEVCHAAPYNHYDPTACAELQSTWTQARTYVEKPAEFMNPYFQNLSCDPFSPINRTCELGNYAVYSINVTAAEHVIAGFDFARRNNIRLVVKTTGHDFMGKSTGKGALSLWMHNLKDKSIVQSYFDPNSTYTGPAARLGAGVTGGEADEFIGAAGYRVVAGECASVGFVGGYTQGGGHSLLSGAYGMSADNVLEWEVVNPQGKHLVATPSSNADLYWAISGGGGGTFGVVVSVTVTIHPDGQVASGSLRFDLAGSGSAGHDETAFWQAIESWFLSLPVFLGLDNTTAAGPRNSTALVAISSSTFLVFSITFPDQTVAQLESTMAPYLAQLDALNINYTLSATQYDSYINAFNSSADLGPLPWGNLPTTEVWTSRLLPASFVKNATAVADLVSVYRHAVQNDTFTVGCNVLAGAGAPAHPDNAVFPGWRDLATICNVLYQWDFRAALEENLAYKRELVSVLQPAIEAATPGTGVYLNEMDPWYQGDWKTEMYGANYDRLLDIKHAYDPDNLMWGLFAVGSDELTLDGSGRLCRA
ncbi:putative FAD-dependent isoamyl alcohol [Rosellinia necatrix]|uniref:Putative FAD-dependent isoamyl alcohol n=1 Tax=Rosellinia necatrix TaxID=77044 RepID=A0A1W2TWS8_ROSNE|nr:putative FAD-dependent isoamyl alcohol [Rosellinia necatrix]